MKTIKEYEKARDAVIEEAIEILNTGTLKEVAEKVGLSFQQVDFLRKGKRKLTGEKAVDIIKKFNKM
ncbi:MAG: helix-turn-helix domain-containing protein [Spirochaetes bacterium]|nr:helix-turn-helix domain-containing protein [Spirochaetota bacterium]